MRVLVTGSTGMIGGSLVSQLQSEGHGIWHLVRTKRGSGRGSEFLWNVEAEQIDTECFKGIDVVVHLAGENIAAKRWSIARKMALAHSRIMGTKLLVDSILKLEKKPKLFITASGVGFYGNRGNEELSEKSKAGEGFLAELATEWEQESLALEQAGVRVVKLRFGMVLSRYGGALPKLARIFRMGLGGKLGNGMQYMSWIHIEDLVRIVSIIIKDETSSGAYNIVAPNAVRNHEFTAALAKAFKRPAFFAVPAFMVNLLFGEMGKELLLSSTKVVPEKLIQAGYQFQFPDIGPALEELVSKKIIS